MQFIERSALGLRAAVHTLRHPELELSFVLFPMIHIGTTEYYDSIRRRLSSCDALVLEGVRSSRAALMTRVYRLLVHRKRLGLVTQHYMEVRSLPCRILHGDLSSESFDAAWDKLPWQTRWLYAAVLPAAAIYFFLVLTRERIAKKLETNDQPSRDDILRDEDPGLDPVVRDARDAHLIQLLKQLVKSEGASSQKVGIVWGAGHMPPVTRILLDDLGYRIVTSEWETVFEL